MSFNFCGIGMGTLGIYVDWSSSPHRTISNGNFLHSFLHFPSTQGENGHHLGTVHAVWFLPLFSASRVGLSL